MFWIPKNNPARILASGNIIVNAGEISNEYSSINAGGSLISVSSVPFKNVGKELNKTTRHVETTVCDGGDFRFVEVFPIGMDWRCC